MLAALVVAEHYSIIENNIHICNFDTLSVSKWNKAGNAKKLTVHLSVCSLIKCIPVMGAAVGAIISFTEAQDGFANAAAAA